ncbi:MAG: hypothetical protein GJV46_10640 [Geobacter sp.]|nr:hypothetical protein [Geobacter sp.]
MTNNNNSPINTFRQKYLALISTIVFLMPVISFAESEWPQPDLANTELSEHNQPVFPPEEPPQHIEPVPQPEQQIQPTADIQPEVAVPVEAPPGAQNPVEIPTDLQTEVPTPAIEPTVDAPPLTEEPVPDAQPAPTADETIQEVPQQLHTNPIIPNEPPEELEVPK